MGAVLVVLADTHHRRKRRGLLAQRYGDAEELREPRGFLGRAEIGDVEERRQREEGVESYPVLGVDVLECQRCYRLDRRNARAEVREPVRVIGHFGTKIARNRLRTAGDVLTVID